MTAAEYPAWYDEALCAQADPEAWYPESGRPTGRGARSICKACPSAAPCLEYALATDQQWGIWGGLSPRQRRALKREES